jgi:hypothetical protein
LRYLTAGKGTWVNCESGSETTIGGFVTVGFNRSPTPPASSLSGKGQPSNYEDWGTRLSVDCVTYGRWSAHGLISNTPVGAKCSIFLVMT